MSDWVWWAVAAANAASAGDLVCGMVRIWECARKCHVGRRAVVSHAVTGGKLVSVLEAITAHGSVPLPKDAGVSLVGAATSVLLIVTLGMLSLAVHERWGPGCMSGAALTWGAVYLVAQEEMRSELRTWRARVEWFDGLLRDLGKEAMR